MFVERSHKIMTQKKTQSAAQGNSQLGFSSFHDRFETLETEHQWLLKQIKRKRTELTNFLEQMRSIAIEIIQRGQPFHERLVELDREIHSIFEQILSQRKMKKQTRHKVEKVYRSLQMMGAISPKYNEDDEDDDDDEDLDEEFFRDRTGEDEDFRSDFNYGRNQQDDNAPPNHDTSTSEDLKELRRRFLRLASTFHPDKVTDGENKEDYEEIMKEVNRAYEEGDMARLLEIERQYELERSVDLKNSSKSEIERRCDRLERDNQALKTQYENIKSELRWMRRTPEGEMVKEYRSLVREGYDPIEETIAEAKSHIQDMEMIRDFVASFRDKKITIQQFLKGPSMGHRVSEEDLQEMVAEFLSDLGIFHRDDF